METTDRHLLVLTTAGSGEEAERIARGLVERRLAACVNVVDQATSVYRWKGEVSIDQEKLLLVKTEAKRLDELEIALRELHSYDVPELVAIPIRHGSKAYLDWVSENI